MIGTQNELAGIKHERSMCGRNVWEREREEENELKKGRNGNESLFSRENM